LRIKSVSRTSLSESAAGTLAAYILEWKFKPGDQLPPEREMMSQLGVSRPTLREALQVLAQNDLIEPRHGVGWFVRALDSTNLAQARTLARSHGSVKVAPSSRQQPSSGIERLRVASEKPIRIPNLHTDRLGTFEFLSWWERDKVAAAKVMVVGAGALGNEVLKNLALMGIGNIFILDFDKVEAANLSRSVLFREEDSGREKAEIAAARVKALNPDVHVQYMHGDVTTELGLGVIRRMDVVIGCLDNREARLAVNRFCYWMNKPWVDGAIQELLGLARVFVPGQGACFECTLTEEARRDLSLRYSCPLLARQNVLRGKVPTTPTIASIIGAIQSQEALKLIHGMPVEPGKVIHFNGMINDMHTSAYVPDENCESHWRYGDIVELGARTETMTLKDFLQIVHADLGNDAVIELDQELIVSLNCPQGHGKDEILRPLSDVSFEAAHCPTCGVLRETEMTHLVSGDEPYLHRTLASVGVPSLHIMRAHNAQEYRFYELTGDLPEALHFHHFERSGSDETPTALRRIRLGDQVQIDPDSKRHSRVLFRN
jgi:molybdopterin/thiamine biosynthesis adenylyltransferase/DNA-binding transcriptional regulator YhcF (GntR family)